MKPRCPLADVVGGSGVPSEFCSPRFSFSSVVSDQSGRAEPAPYSRRRMRSRSSSGTQCANVSTLVWHSRKDRILSGGRAGHIQRDIPSGWTRVLCDHHSISSSRSHCKRRSTPEWVNWSADP
jgi:hypothetical protein